MNWCYSSAIMLVLTALLLTNPSRSEAAVTEVCSDTLNFTFKRLDQSRDERLCKQYRGKLLLIVNTASKCAFTPQYDGLEKLYREYKSRGLVVLGFPSNDFAGQEPGTEKQILNFCRLTYNVEFPMFEKVHVIQQNAAPFYQKLAELAGEYPKWNFHKYLISTDGQLIGSFKSNVKPSDSALIKLINQHLPE